ncbi:MAG: MEDS domain-containing protein, partial [Pseudonocardiaceae bacterium]
MLTDDAGRGRSPDAALARDAGLVHEALFYRDSDDYAVAITSFLREGFELAQPALVAVPRSHLDLLRSALGSDAECVEFIDMTEAGRNPGRIIRTVLHAFVRDHPHRRVRIVDEPIWPGRSAAECRAALQHEALINIALADY